MNKKAILIIVAVVLVAALAVAYFLVRPGGTLGPKDFTLVVVHKDGMEKRIPLRSNEEFLGAALLNEGLLEGEDGPYGLYIQKVDGEKAVYEEDGAYWAFYVGDEYAALGIDQTPIEHGQVYKLIYTLDTGEY